MCSIKFRQPLWDKHNKFAAWHYWGFIENCFVEPDFSPFSSYQEAKEQSQQFIGCTDTHGKEIYEGDIVKHRDGGIAEVFYNEQRAMFALDPTNYDETWNSDRQISPSDDWGLCEVIGNKYETSDEKQ
jgi:hypothetical protein